MEKSIALAILAELIPVRREAEKQTIIVLSNELYYALLTHLIEVSKPTTMEDCIYRFRALLSKTHHWSINVTSEGLVIRAGALEWSLTDTDSFSEVYGNIARYLTE